VGEDAGFSPEATLTSTTTPSPSKKEDWSTTMYQ
jgi:hypothetical protein